MTAIDKKFCDDNALSCGAIQNVLEKAPGLVFVNGAFRHKYSLVPPSPPPDPSPPPRALSYAPHPPSAAAAAREPAPLLRGRRGLPAAAAPHRLRPGHHDRRHRRRRDRGARELPLRAPRLGREAAREAPASPTSPSPTPLRHPCASCTTRRPRPACGGSASGWATWRPTRRRARPTARSGPTDTASAMSGTEALIDALGENNPILRDMLQTAKQEIYTAGADNAAVTRRPRGLRGGHARRTPRRPPRTDAPHRPARRATAAGSCSAASTTCA